MPLDDTIGQPLGINPTEYVNQLIQWQAQQAQLHPDAVTNRLDRKGLQPQETPQQGNDFSSFGTPADQLGTAPSGGGADFSSFGTPVDQEGKPVEKPEEKPSREPQGIADTLVAREAGQAAVTAAGHFHEELGRVGPVGGVAIMSAVAQKMQAGMPREQAVREATAEARQATQKAGAEIAAQAPQTFPATPQERAEHPYQSAIGQFIGGAGPAAAGALLGGAPGVIAGAAYMGLSSAGASYDDAIAKGATDEQAMRAAGLTGGVTAAISTIPLGAIIAPIRQVAPGLVGWAAAKLAQAGVSGIAFGSIGEAQQYLAEQIAKSYDPSAEYSFDIHRVIANLVGGGVLGMAHPLTKAATAVPGERANIGGEDVAVATRQGGVPGGPRPGAPEGGGGLLGDAAQTMDEFVRQRDAARAAGQGQEFQDALRAAEQAGRGRGTIDVLNGFLRDWAKRAPTEPPTEEGEAGPRYVYQSEAVHISDALYAKGYSAENIQNNWPLIAAAGKEVAAGRTGLSEAVAAIEAHPSQTLGQIKPGAAESHSAQLAAQQSEDGQSTGRIQRGGAADNLVQDEEGIGGIARGAQGRHLLGPKAEEGKPTTTETRPSDEDELRAFMKQPFKPRAERQPEGETSEASGTVRTETPQTPQTRSGAVSETPKTGPEAINAPTTAPVETGTRVAPITLTKPEDIDRAGAVADPNPTPAQAQAENYQHAHVEIPELGLTGARSVSIETTEGGIRLGPPDETGKPAWMSTMGATYGRIKGTKGADGEPLDIFIGKQPGAGEVYIVDQKDPKTGAFDEHKIFAHFPDGLAAVNAYLKSYDDNALDRIGSLRRFTPQEFQEWLKGDTTKPLLMEGAGGAAEPPKGSAGGGQSEAPTAPAAISATETRPGGVSTAMEPGRHDLHQNQLAVEAALRAAGEDPAGVRPADIAHAAEIMAHEGYGPKDAFQIAFVRSLLEDGRETPKSIKEIYGPDIAKAVLEPKQPSQRGVSTEAPSAGAGRPATETGVGPAAQQRPSGGKAGKAGPQAAEAAGSEAGGRAPGTKPAAHPEGAPAGAKRPAEPGERGTPRRPEAAGPANERPAKTPTAAKGPVEHSLLEFLAARGGLKPTPELRDLNLPRGILVPGLGYRSIIRGKGESLDRARMAAVEAGYLADEGAGGGKTTPNDLLKLISAEARGKRQMPLGSEELKTKHEQQIVDEQNADRKEALEAQRAKIVAYLKETNEPISMYRPEDIEAATEMMEDHGTPVGQAIEAAVMRNDAKADLEPDEVFVDNYGEAYHDEVQPAAAPQHGEAAHGVRGEGTKGPEAGAGERGEALPVAGETEREGAEGGRRHPAAAAEPGPAGPAGQPATGGQPAERPAERPISGRPSVAPDVVYHGTPNEVIGNFDRHAGSPAKAGRDTVDMVGSWFTTSKTNARDFGHIVIPVKLTITNPLVVNAWAGLDAVAKKNNLERVDNKTRSYFQISGKKLRAWLEEQGYDGIHMIGGEDGKSGIDYWVALNPDQIERLQTTEPTAAGPQHVLPGAEKAPEKEQAQRGAEKPLKPKVAQKPADEGLFGDQAGQTDLVDMAKAQTTRQYTVPYLAGASDTPSGYPVHIDHRFPQEMTVKGKTFNPDPFLVKHEIAEHDEMLKGTPYHAAHKVGLAAEKAAIEAAGIDWDAYQEQMLRAVEKIEKEPHDNPPPNLYTKPYPHKEAEFLKHEAEQNAQAETVDQGKGKAVPGTETGAAPGKEPLEIIPGDGIEALIFENHDQAMTFNVMFRDKETGNMLPTGYVKISSLIAARAKALDALQGKRKLPGESPVYGPDVRLAHALLALLKAGKPITNKALQQSATEAHGGKLAEGKFDRKDAHDALELAVNMLVKEDVGLHTGLLPGWERPIQQLDKLLDRLPTQTVRSEEQIALQQFSTPPPYAFAVAYAAGIRNGDTVLEPSAGTGSIVAAATHPGVRIIANELSPRRAELIKALVGPDGVVHTENAEQIDNILKEKPTVVVMNPPFSRSGERMGNKKLIGIGAEHVEAALNLLEPGGRLVAILGRGMAPDANKFKDWWRKIAAENTIRANIGVSGEVYKKYGTTFGTRLVVIDKLPPTRAAHAGGTLDQPVVRDVGTVPELMQALEGIRETRPQLRPAEPSRPALAAGGQGTGAGPLPLPPQPGVVGPGTGHPGGLARPPHDTATTRPPIRVEAGERPGVAPVEPGGAVQGGAAGQPAKPHPGGVEPPPGVSGHPGGNLQPPAVAEPGTPGGYGLKELQERADYWTKRDQATSSFDFIQYRNDAKPLLRELAEIERDWKDAERHLFRNEGVDDKTRPQIGRPWSGVIGGVRDHMRVAIDMLEQRPQTKAILDRARAELAAPPTTAAPLGTEKVDLEHADPGTQGAANITDSLYEPYEPKKVRIKGAKKHPGPLVESAAMASVDAPDPTYRPTLPKEVIEKGMLSLPQLEAVVYAGQAHAKTLPAAEGETARRRGYFIGDGCVAAGTRIFNPKTGCHTAIEELVGRQHVVLSLTATGFEPRTAEITFLKGTADLYRVILDDGREITVTDQHRFLTLNGWSDLQSLSVGDHLATAEVADTSSFAIHGAYDRLGSRRPQDCLDHCLSDYRHCGAPPLPEAGSVQERLRRQGGVLGHNHLSLHRDGQDISPSHSGRDPFECHLARNSSVPTESRALVSMATRDSEASALSWPERRRTAEQSPAGREQLRRSGNAEPSYQQTAAAFDWSQNESAASSRHSQAHRLSSAVSRRIGPQAIRSIVPPYRPQRQRDADLMECSYEACAWRKIARIEFVGRDKFYDMYVPGPENYVAEGFVNHNTGVGKGREISGIILDNWQQGRTKAVWVSEKKKLLNDAKRDWSGLGQDPKVIFNAGGTKTGEGISAQRGIAFVTYDTLKGGMSDQKKLAQGQFVRKQKVTVNGQPGIITKTDPLTVKLDDGQEFLGDTPDAIDAIEPLGAAPKSRIDQLVDWLGPDFDGVIAFDEAHNMGNVTTTKGDRGLKEAAQKALAGMELQKRLPNARVVYVSATGATEVANLGYAERLGLWGRGTAFADRNKFINEVNSGGIAAMELIARDMKNLGLYTARNLSYDDGTAKGRVEYDRLNHVLDKNQREIYDTAAEAWQIVLQSIQSALELTGGSQDSRAKSAALSVFWGGHQRFFNQIITSLQMPTVIKAVEKDLEAGRQVVLQLTNTNEASQERAAAKAETAEDIEDLDITPRDQIIQLIEHSFPTQEYEPFIDDNGNEGVRAVVNSEGNLVQNKEALRMKEELIDRLSSLRVPQGPLDLILDHFGHEVAAEVTGRGRRFIMKTDEKTGERKRMEESRPGSANQNEIDNFQAGKKKILVFSEAGGTGASYHADNGSASKDARRSHYLVQAGWRADKAVQGFGRTHRTNQASAPIFHLVSTDIEGQKRFISSIARRLGQLGALTKGQRQAGDQGIFSARDNLESIEAKTALQQFFNDLIYGHAGDINIDDFERQTGLKLQTRDKDGRVTGITTQLPQITQFLNRLLSMKIEMQNRVFQAFSERLDSVIEARKEAGLLDVGLETVKADKIEKQSEQVVHTDKESGAQTKHVKLRVSEKLVPIPFKFVANNPARPVRLWVQSPTGKVYAAAETPHKTEGDSGRIVEQYRLISPVAQPRLIPQESLRGERWTIIDPGKAREMWDAEIASAPEFVDRDMHLITGAVLPVWDRLRGNSRIVRLNTDAGERMLGRVIAQKDVAATLKALGADAGAAGKVDPTRLFGNLMAGGSAKLANDWRLKRSLVTGEHRIELLGPSSFGEGQEVKRDGVFTERIGYQTRYFIPTDPESGRRVLEKITEYRPVVSMERGNEPEIGFSEGLKPFRFEQPRRTDERTVSGRMAGVGFHVTHSQHEQMKAARSAGATKEEIQRMVDGFTQNAKGALRDRIIEAYFKAAGNRFNGRAELADIREALHDVPRQQLDAELVRMFLDPAQNTQLYGDDNQAMITPRQHAAAIDFKGFKKHILWIDRDPRFGFAERGKETEFHDLGPYVGEDPLGKDVQDYVVERGRATGVEHLVVIDRHGDVVLHGHGDETATGTLPEDAAKLFFDPEQQLIVHHNHPSNGTLSGPDIGMLGLHGLKAVWAHGHGGLVARAELTDRAREVLPNLPYNRMGLIHLVIKAVGLAFYDRLQHAIMRDDLHPLDATKIRVHLINTALHRAGIIDYDHNIDAAAAIAEFDFEPNIQQAAETAAREFFNDEPQLHRPAEPLRHPGDLGATFGVPQAVASRYGAVEGVNEGRRGGDRPQEAAVEFREFGGEKAETADREALAEAKRLDAGGSTPEEIWHQTGWYKRPDGWRFEIDDSKVRFKPKALLEQSGRYSDGTEYSYSGRLGDLVESATRKGMRIFPVSSEPDFIRAYPDLANIEVSIGGVTSFISAGGYDPVKDTIHIDTDTDKDRLFSVLLHEIQHAIQWREGFASGGNAGTIAARTNAALFDLKHQIAALRPGSNIRSELERLHKELASQAQMFGGGVAGFGVTNRQTDAYRRLLGEVEARNTEARQRMSAAQRRAAFPRETEDVPANEQYRGSDLSLVREANAGLVDRLVAEEYARSGIDGRDRVDVYGDKTVQRWIGVTLDEISGWKGIEGKRTNFTESLDFSPEDIADKVKQYGATALRNALEPKISGFRRLALDRRDDSKKWPDSPRNLEGQAVEFDHIADLNEKTVALLDRITKAHPELGPRPSYDVKAADPEGLIESYQGRTWTPEERRDLKDQIADVISTMGQNGDLTEDEAYRLGYDFDAQGLGNEFGADISHPEAFAKLYAKHKALIDDYRAATDYVDYAANKANFKEAARALSFREEMPQTPVGLYGKLTPKAVAKRAEVETTLQQWLTHLAGANARLETPDRIVIENPPGYEGLNVPSGSSGGSYGPEMWTVRIALGDPKWKDPLSSLFHEGFHWAEDHFATDLEMQVMRREEAALRRHVERYIGVPEGHLDAMAGFEIRAYAFQRYMDARFSGQAPTGIHAGIRRFFERLFDLVKRTKNFLSGLGFRTANDFFADIAAGKAAQREDRMLPKPSRILEELAGAPEAARMLPTAFEMRDAVQRTAAVVKDFWTSKFQPELFSELALKADPLFAKYASSTAQEKDSFVKLVDGDWYYWNRQPLNKRYAFMAAMEGVLGAGHPPLTLAERTMRDFYKDMFDRNFAEEQRMGSKAGYFDDYFPHIWKSEARARAFMDTMTKQIGPTWFQKKRYHQTIEDGLAAGLELRSTNPIDLIVHRLLSGVDMRMRMQLLYDLHDMRLAFKTKEAPAFAKFPRRGIRDIWHAVNAPDRQQWLLAPDIRHLWENGVAARGLWGADGFFGGAFRGWMKFKNAWVPVKLALSAFHPLHVLHITQADHFARAYQQAKGGDWAGASKSLGRSLMTIPTLGLLDYREGRKYTKAWQKRRDQMTPQEKVAIDLAHEGGVSFQLSEQLRIKARHDLAKAWHDPSFKVIPAAMRRAIEFIQAPIFEHWIPALKASAYMREAAALLQRRPDYSNDYVQRRAALRAIGKSIDNRFGEMFYKSLFWNKMLKDGAVGSFLSLGWNLGFLREFIGGIGEIATRGAVLTGAYKPTQTRTNIRDATSKIPFIAAYVASAMAINGLMTYANTGQDPEGWDYVFARAGGENPDGTPRRWTNMFYTREVPMLAKHIEEQNSISGGIASMVWNKTTFEPIVEVFQNKDYWGYQLWNPDAAWYKQVYQGLSHFFSDLESPITISGAQRALDTGGTSKDVAAAFAGFGPAPGYVEKTAIQNRIAYLYRGFVAAELKPAEDEENSQAKMRVRSRILQAKRTGDQAGLDAARSMGLKLGMKPESMNKIGKEPSDVYMFSRLLNQNQIDVLRMASPEEYQRYIKHAHQEVKNELGKVK